MTGAICINVVYFVSELDSAFAELARILAPGGRLVLGIADPEAMAAMPFTRTGFLIRPVDELVETLATAGLPVTGHKRLGKSEHAYHLLVVGS